MKRYTLTDTQFLDLIDRAGRKELADLQREIDKAVRLVKDAESRYHAIDDTDDFSRASANVTMIQRKANVESLVSRMVTVREDIEANRCIPKSLFN